MKTTLTLYPGAWQQCVTAAIQQIRALKPDRVRTITIGERKRSLSQNSRWHSMAAELATEIGYTPEELKRLAKHELGRFTVIDGPCGKIKRLESSADWDKDEMAEAIDLLNRWACEVGHRWRVE